MAVLRRPLNDASSSSSVPAFPLVVNVFGCGTDRVVGPAGILVLQKWHFALACVEHHGGFGGSTGVVVDVGDDTGISSDSGVPVLCRGGL